MVAPFVMFLLKLESKLLVSQNAIQAIVNEIKMLSESADEYHKSELMKSLEMPEIQLSKFHRIMDKASLSASLLKHHNIFGTAYCRKQFFQSSLFWVPDRWNPEVLVKTSTLRDCACGAILSE